MSIATDDSCVIVCGGGMAGLSAALAASEAGARVVIVEKGPKVGGTAELSGGRIWSFTDPRRLRDSIPDGDPVLQQLVCDSLKECWTWLERQGVRLGPEEPAAVHGRGRKMAPTQAIPALLGRFRSLGGTLFTDTALDELIVEEGVVVGIRAVQSQQMRTLRGSAVILATGGFQGNPELLTRYVVSPDNLCLRANPWSTGDGLLAATRVGAAISQGLDTFYGHAMIAPPGKFDEKHFLDVTQSYGQNAVALNLSGLRFVDESEGDGAEVLNQRLARQPEGRAFYVIDAAIAAKSVGDVLTKVMIERARLYGASVIEADTLEKLSEGLQEQGLPADKVLGTLLTYNNAVQDPSTSDPVPPRRRRRYPLQHPPFYAVGVKASITFTMGGLAVDEKMRVLRRSASSSFIAQSITSIAEYRTTPICGLFAAGCDVGNLSHVGYMGGLAPAVATGRVAGAEAARLARSSVGTLR